MKCEICGIEQNKGRYCSQRCISKAHYWRHHEEQLERLRKWRESNRPLARKLTHDWYERTKILKTHDHPCLICGTTTRNRKYCSVRCNKKSEYRRNRERYNQSSKKYFQNHTDRRKQDSKKWYYKNKERAYFYELMQPHRAELRALFNNECQICHTKENLDLHHIKYAWNPVDIAANKKFLTLLCNPCHMKVHSGELTLDNH
jgi:hypothetical protein